MQPLFADVSNLLFSLGRSNPALVVSVALFAPSAATFAVMMIFRKLTSACWRGYWDVV